MNYLGHLYFSSDNHALMLANLYGDFVKGKNYTYLPEIVQKGVSLHRKIDDFIDHHPAVTQFRMKLYHDLPKVAGIAIDLYFDHLLAKNWKVFHQQELNEFIDQFLTYALNPKHLTFHEKKFSYPQNYIHLLTLIQRYNWMKKYVYLKGLNKAASGLSKRISFENNLNQASKFYLKHEIEVQSVFNQYMRDAKEEFN